MRIVESSENAWAKSRKVRPNGAARTARPGSYGEAVVRVGLLLIAQCIPPPGAAEDSP
jgi:hypothetical protein